MLTKFYIKIKVTHDSLGNKLSHGFKLLNLKK